MRFITHCDPFFMSRHTHKRQQLIKWIASANPVTVHNRIVGPYGKPMNVESNFSDLPQYLFDKINTCMEAQEPFGLECEDSVVIFLPAQLAAAWYDREYNKTIQEVTDRPAFIFMLTGVLYTHQGFIGPLQVHKFVTAVKVITDERERRNSQPLLPDAALPEPGEPAGPMETGNSGI